MSSSSGECESDLLCKRCNICFYSLPASFLLERLPFSFLVMMAYIYIHVTAKALPHRGEAIGSLLGISVHSLPRPRPYPIRGGGGSYEAAFLQPLHDIVLL